MSKFVGFKNILHIVAIVASAVVSALTAAGMGGDPILGAAIGAGSNTLVHIGQQFV